MGGAIVGALSFVYGVAQLFSESASSTLFVLIGMGCLAAMGVNIIRLRQINEFLTHQKYKLSVSSNNKLGERWYKHEHHRMHETNP